MQAMVTTRGGERGDCFGGMGEGWISVLPKIPSVAETQKRAS